MDEKLTYIKKLFETCFGLFPARLVYNGKYAGPEAKRVSYTEQLAQKSVIGEKEKELKGAKEKKEKAIQEINKKVAEYNKRYGGKGAPSEKEPYRATLKPVDFNNLNASIAQVDSMLAAPFMQPGVEDQWYSLLDKDETGQYKPSTSPAFDGITDALLEIRLLLSTQTKFLKYEEAEGQVGYIKKATAGMEIDFEGHEFPRPGDAPEKKIEKLQALAEYLQGEAQSQEPDKKIKLLRLANEILVQITIAQMAAGKTSYRDLKEKEHDAEEKLNGAKGGLLDSQRENMQASGVLLAQFEKNPHYQNLQNRYNLAVKNLVLGQTPEMEGMKTGPEGVVSIMRARENEKLFFAIWQTETSNFSDGLILDTRFQDNEEENIANFPFLHKEWMAKKGMNEPRVQELAARAQKAPRPEGSVAAVMANDQVLLDPELKRCADLSSDQNNSEGWGKHIEALNALILQYRRLEGSDQINAQKYKEKIQKLITHREYSEAQYRWRRAVEKKTAVQKKFTRRDLMDPHSQQILTEIMLKQFMKAKDLVDNTFFNSPTGRMLNPAVRRMLIAAVFKQGVTEGLSDGKTIDLNSSYGKMLSMLIQSNSFNLLANKNFIGEPEIFAIQLVNWVNLIQNRVHVVEKKLEEEKKKQPPDTAKIAGLESNISIYKDFVTHTTDYIEHFENPTEDDKKWLKAMQEGQGLQDEELKFYANEMEEWKKLQKVNENFSMLDLDEKKSIKFFERFDINIEGFYGGYEKYVAGPPAHPELKVENWNDILAGGDKKTFDALIAMLEATIPPSTEGGKGVFLDTLKTMHGYKPLPNQPETSNVQMTALSLFGLLIKEIETRQTIKQQGQQQNALIEARLGGLNIGHTVEYYGRQVVDMLIGPGQPLSSRVAGIALLAIAYKGVSAAWKGEGKWGKLLRAGGIAAAIEIAMKQITGRGILDRAGLLDVASASEGTYEAVLVNQGEKNKLMIDRDTKLNENMHHAALYQLKNVPFADVMKWYMSCDEKGNPKEGKRDNYFPKRIDIGAIAKHYKGHKVDSGLVARHATYLAVQNLMEYIGNKEYGDHRLGTKLAEDRWIKPFTEKGFDVSKVKYSNFTPSKEMIDEYRKKPSDLTWAAVMTAEIDPEDVRRTIGTSLVDRAMEMGREALSAGKVYARGLYGVLDPEVTEFKANLGEEYWPAFTGFLDKTVDYTETTFLFLKESVKWKYKEHEYEIKRFGLMHWELLTEGIKLPFEVVYGILRAGTPWITTKIRQLKEIVSPDRLSAMDHPLTMDDIVPSVPPGLRTGTTANPDAFDRDKNPNFYNFGFYSEHFLKAFDEGTKIPTNEKYYEHKDPNDPLVSGIGYYISDVSESDANVTPTDPPSDRRGKLMDASYKRAVQKFKGIAQTKGVPMNDSQIKDYLNPIHVIVGKDGEKEKMYVFWRMPLPGSMELTLKEGGHWPDYMDASYIKDRAPFKIDPKDGLIKSLRKALGLDTAFPRIIGGAAGIAIAQWLRALYGIAEGGGKIIDKLSQATKYKFDVKWLRELTTVEEKTLQKIDETLTSAAYPGLALSKFYRKSDNAEKYKKIVEESRKKGEQDFKLPEDGWVSADYEEWDGKAKKMVAKKTGTKRMNPDLYK